MKPPLYVHPLTPKEHRQLEAARRSSNVFCLRRAQIVLASARGQSAKPIAQFLGCSVQTVRNVIRAFNAGGMSCLAKRSNRPTSDVVDSSTYRVASRRWTRRSVNNCATCCINPRAALVSLQDCGRSPSPPKYATSKA